ncbi:MAG: prolyl oligopeptidase family serine peptidase, partial [Planctomycetota bacterium]
ELAHDASPVVWIDPADPPVFIAHGAKDRLIPVRQSRRFAAALADARVHHELHVVDGVGHGSLGAIEIEAIRFLERELRRDPLALFPSTRLAGPRLEFIGPSIHVPRVPMRDGAMHAVVAASHRGSRVLLWLEDGLQSPGCSATAVTRARPSGAPSDPVVAGMTWRYEAWSRIVIP